MRTGEGGGERLDLDPVWLLGVPMCLFDLADHARVHKTWLLHVAAVQMVDQSVQIAADLTIASGHHEDTGTGAGGNTMKKRTVEPGSNGASIPD
jgi:hypothetical protein